MGRVDGGQEWRGPDHEVRCRRLSRALCLRSERFDPLNYGFASTEMKRARPVAATSTPLGDRGETLAVKKTFGAHSHKFAFSSTKSMTGHLLGAAGGIEAVFTVLALHLRKLPPTINYNAPDPECDPGLRGERSARNACRVRAHKRFRLRRYERRTRFQTLRGVKKYVGGARGDDTLKTISRHLTISSRASFVTILPKRS